MIIFNLKIKLLDLHFTIVTSIYLMSYQCYRSLAVPLHCRLDCKTHIQPEKNSDAKIIHREIDRIHGNNSGFNEI